MPGHAARSGRAIVVEDQPMSDLILGPIDGDAVEPGRNPALRTLLAGDFAAANCRQCRSVGELPGAPDGARLHWITPGFGLDGAVDRAEVELAEGRVDLVLLDLDGSVRALLDVVERLRASACDHVVFIGVLPLAAEPPERLYLSAVMDAVVDAPLRAGSLHRAIADALESAGLQDSSKRLMMAGPPTRH